MSSVKGSNGMTVVLVFLSCLLVTTVFSAEWWEEEMEEQEQAMESGELKTISAGKTLWNLGYIESVGEASCDMDEALSETDCYVTARRTAIVLAQEKLSEMVNGVVIDGESVLKNELLKSSTLRLKTVGLIRGAEIVAEDRITLDDGSILARIRMRLPLYGSDGLSDMVIRHAAEAADERPIPRFDISAPPKPLPCTGIIIDATSIDASPAMAPKILVLEELNAALSIDQVDIDIASNIGMVAYASDIESAREIEDRAGISPLIIRAEMAAGKTRADIVISADDGVRLKAADPDGDIIRSCRVVFAGESFF